MTVIDTDLGEVTRTGDQLHIVFRRRYARPIEKVWAALTVPERLNDWFAETTIDRLEVGGTMQLYFTGADYRSLAKIEVYDPPRTIAWIWSEMDGAKPSYVRFDLEPDGDGCRLTLTHDIAAGEAKGVPAGWHAHLEAFEDAVDGVFTPWDKLIEREKRISPLYAHLG